MPPDVRVGELGRYAVAVATRIYHQELWPTTKDPAYLRACRALAEQYLQDLDDARAAGLPTSEPNAEEEQIRKTLEAVRSELDPPRTEPKPLAPEPLAPEPLAPAKPPPVAEPARRDMLATSMVTIGTLLVVGGVVFTVDGFLYPSMIRKAKAKQRAIDEMQGDLAPGDPDPREYVDHERKLRRIGHTFLGVGLGGLGLGIALMTLGSMRFARSQQASRTANLRIMPQLGRNGAGVSAMLRF